MNCRLIKHRPYSTLILCGDQELCYFQASLPDVADEFDFVFFAETDDEVALDQLAASAGFFLAVDGDFFGLDQQFCLAAGVYGSDEFEKLVKFNKIFCVLHGDLNQWDL
jgi:hypothetical protein